jgi:hypothetical protein
MFRIAAAAALFVSATAFADHSTHRLDALTAHVNARRAQPGLSRTKARALAAAARTLGKSTSAAASDVAEAARAARLLDRAFPSDAEFGADIDAAVSAFANDLASDRLTLADLLPAITDLKQRSAAQVRFDRVGPLADAADRSASRSTKLSRLARAVGMLTKAYQAAGAATGFVVGLVNDVPFVSEETGSWPTGSNGLSIGATDYDDKSENIYRSITLTADGIAGTGTFALSNDTSYAKSPYNQRSAWWTWSVGRRDVGGTVVITRFDRGARVVEGTFSFTAGIESESENELGRPAPTTVQVAVGRLRGRLP